jgi:hypothetical protein
MCWAGVLSMSDLADTLALWNWEPAPAESSNGDTPPASPQWVEEPVPLDVFIRDARYLKNPPLSEIQYDAVRVAERVYFPATYAMLAASEDRAIREYWAAPLPLVNFIALEWGKGGGKDHTCRMLSMRVAYLTLCLPSAQDYYGVPAQDEIHLLNVASSATQAGLAFFGPMRSAVMRKGCWLGNYADPLQGLIRYSNGVRAVSGHSDAETQEGLNLLLAVADEVDAFKREEELEAHRSGIGRESTKSAEAILKMMRTSMRTRFPQVGKNVFISYPRYKGSMIQQQLERGKKDNARHGTSSRWYVSGPWPTWVANPLRSRFEFDSDYEEDPVLSKARYECEPAAAVNPYFTNEIAVEGCMLDEPAERIAIRYDRRTRTVVHPDGAREQVTSWDARFEFSAAMVPRRGAIYFMHGDLAKNKDRAGVAMAHVRSWEAVEVIGQGPQGEDVPVTERHPVVAVDFVVGFEPDVTATPPREIQISWVLDLFMELRRRGFNVRGFTFDQYQSEQLMQFMLRQGIEAKRVSTDMSVEPYRGLRDLFNENRVELPVCRPVQPDGSFAEPRVVHELFALSRLGNGKLDHPAGGSKDMSDALACAVQGAVMMGGREDGGIAYPGTHSFAGWQDEDSLPVGFELPGMVGGNGYGVQVQHQHVSLEAWEDSVFGGGLGEKDEPLRIPD